MDILELTKPIEQYFLSMNIAEGYVYVNVAFPQDWTISPEDVDEKYNVSVCKNEDGNGYYFFSKLDNGENAINTVFDSIMFTVNFNKEAEEKKALMNQKIEELIQLFVDEDINTLKTLEFKLKKKKRQNKKQEVKEINNNIEEEKVSE